jgi:hypothetical protein
MMQSEMQQLAGLGASGDVCKKLAILGLPWDTRCVEGRLRWDPNLHANRMEDPSNRGGSRGGAHRACSSCCLPTPRHAYLAARTSFEITSVSLARSRAQR